MAHEIDDLNINILKEVNDQGEEVEHEYDNDLLEIANLLGIDVEDQEVEDTAMEQEANENIIAFEIANEEVRALQEQVQKARDREVSQQVREIELELQKAKDDEFPEIIGMDMEGHEFSDSEKSENTESEEEEASEEEMEVEKPEQKRVRGTNHQDSTFPPEIVAVYRKNANLHYQLNQLSYNPQWYGFNTGEILAKTLQHITHNVYVSVISSLIQTVEPTVMLYNLEVEDENHQLLHYVKAKAREFNNTDIHGKPDIVVFFDGTENPTQTKVGDETLKGFEGGKRVIAVEYTSGRDIQAKFDKYIVEGNNLDLIVVRFDGDEVVSYGKDVPEFFDSDILTASLKEEARVIADFRGENNIADARDFDGEPTISHPLAKAIGRNSIYKNYLTYTGKKTVYDAEIIDYISDEQYEEAVLFISNTKGLYHKLSEEEKKLVDEECIKEVSSEMLEYLKVAECKQVGPKHDKVKIDLLWSEAKGRLEHANFLKEEFKDGILDCYDQRGKLKANPHKNKICVVPFGSDYRELLTAVPLLHVEGDLNQKSIKYFVSKFNLEQALLTDPVLSDFWAFINANSRGNVRIGNYPHIDQTFGTSAKGKKTGKKGCPTLNNAWYCDSIPQPTGYMRDYEAFTHTHSMLAMTAPLYTRQNDFIRPGMMTQQALEMIDIQREFDHSKMYEQACCYGEMAERLASFRGNKEAFYIKMPISSNRQTRVVHHNGPGSFERKGELYERVVVINGFAVARVLPSNQDQNPVTFVTFHVMRQVEFEKGHVREGKLISVKKIPNTTLVLVVTLTHLPQYRIVALMNTCVGTAHALQVFEPLCYKTLSGAVPKDEVLEAYRTIVEQTQENLRNRLKDEGVVDEGPGPLACTCALHLQKLTSAGFNQEGLNKVKYNHSPAIMNKAAGDTNEIVLWYSDIAEEFLINTKFECVIFDIISTVQDLESRGLVTAHFMTDEERQKYIESRTGNPKFRKALADTVYVERAKRLGIPDLLKNLERLEKLHSEFDPLL